ncbi:Hypothetical protein GbCGDNIH9_8743 [Granulibacter bethesdensis]|uniref:Uncharacterized protein n=1 Tax=Granulibacter bethesdensis TaxID=364410 RepID=A0AAC9P908_9PROT|nr:Hypothetical protein GbCGDNIH9_8743 [Granulibacter bethesdensis]
MKLTIDWRLRGRHDRGPMPNSFSAFTKSLSRTGSPLRVCGRPGLALPRRRRRFPGTG